MYKEIKINTQSVEATVDLEYEYVGAWPTKMTLVVMLMIFLYLILFQLSSTFTHIL